MNGLLKTGKDMFGMTHAFDEGGDRISNDRPALSIDDWDSKMRRLVAAWNACAGIPTETLEKWSAIGGVTDLIEFNKEAEARADEAVRLLKNTLSDIESAWETARRKDWQAAPYTVEDAFQDIDSLAGKLRAIQRTIVAFLEGK